MAYNNNKDDYKVDNIVIELDTDEDTEEAEKEYIANITAKIMTITNEFISRHPNIDLCTSQGLTELLKDIRRKYKARKAVVGSIVGSMLLGPVNSMVVPFTESIAKPKKLKYKCYNCGRVWEQKI